MRPDFTLTVVASADGFIARSPGESPKGWASAEEQALFRSDVAAADWAVMGRGTHEAADWPDRHRIIFTSSAGEGEWRRPSQLWLDPRRIRPADLANAVAHVRPLRQGIILGGTRVHDWFRQLGAIDSVHLTVEPVRFGSGLPIFSGQTARDPIAIFEAAGFTSTSRVFLNAGGTEYLTMAPLAAGQQAR